MHYFSSLDCIDTSNSFLKDFMLSLANWCSSSLNCFSVCKSDLAFSNIIIKPFFSFSASPNYNLCTVHLHCIVMIHNNKSINVDLTFAWVACNRENVCCDSDENFSNNALHSSIFFSKLRTDYYKK